MCTHSNHCLILKSFFDENNKQDPLNGRHEHNERKKKLIYIYFRIFKTFIEYLSKKLKIS